MLQEHPAVKEQNGICYYKYFRGIPDYGQGLNRRFRDAIYVKDFGVYQKDIIELGPENFNLFILSGSPWDLAQTISTGLELSRLGNTALSVITITSPLQKKLAGKLGCKVYCFPFDGDAFTCTETKTDLFFHVLSFERGKKKFLNFRKRQPKNIIRSASVAAVTAVVSRIFPLHCQTTVLPNCAVPLPVWN